MPIDQKLVNCDLCILAYQNYHQAVIWPLDPWYEVLARGGSDRRTLFMRGVHGLAKKAPLKDRSREAMYAGPASVGNLGASNETLDPIITNYLQINPKIPAFTGDGERYLVLETPAYLLQNLRSVKLACYTNVSRETAISTIRDYGAGRDEMVVFEGGTGSVGGSTGASSPMGFVLKRHPEGGTAWDAHIVFRGSRSGSAGRAATQAMNGPFSGPMGNPDWVTDMSSSPVSNATDKAFVGGLGAAGMVHALQLCFPAIVAALREIARSAGEPPTNIHVAGHSLGAALASTLCAALTLTKSASAADAPGKQVRTGALAAWPWDAMQGWFYALPPTGTKEFCFSFLTSGIRTTAPYCDGDMVVECSNSIGTFDTGMGGKFGWVAGSGGYTAGTLEKLPKPAGAASGENPHEIYLIRAAIIHKLGKLNVSGPVRDAQPWGIFDTFRDVLDGRSQNFRGGGAPPSIGTLTRHNLRAVLQNYRFAHHLEIFLGMLGDVVSNKGAYIGKHFASTLLQLKENVELARGLELAPGDSPRVDDITDRVATQVSILCAFQAAKHKYLGLGKAKAEADGSLTLKADDMLGQDFSTRIGLGMLLAAIEKYENTSVADYEKLEVLRLCLDVRLS
ncbi:MAG TPA: hypothetical protein VHM70_16785 [Polyangiaceae bacterium]|jgi:hypothetical protein|nr:hypothetical protein [Polyangiaceae bacterium]